MNQIKQKVAEIGLSQREISKRLGKNASYLAGVFRTGLSTAKQAKLLKYLEVVGKGGHFQSEGDIIAELDRSIAKLQAANSELRNESDKYFNELNEAHTKVEQLRDTIQWKQNQLTQTQKYLMVANQNCELFETKYRKIAFWNWALCIASVAVLILWVVV